MKALADQVHALGLKFGLYTCAGNYTCSSGGRDHKIPGSFGHYQQDANSYASWGVDFVKMDWCNTNGLNPKVQYPEMTKALNATGRPIFFEMCEWGLDDPWLWATPVANQWRTTGDHHDNWASTSSVIQAQVGLAQYSGRSAWNYMDFIYTGGQGCANDPNKHCPGQTDTEYMTEFTFWSFFEFWTDCCH
jgi:alpha-galactosidase